VFRAIWSRNYLRYCWHADYKHPGMDMNKHILALCAWLFVMCPSMAADPLPMAQGQEIESIADVLDSFHASAAIADWLTYFGLMSDDAVFIGTDAAERWSKSEFQTYASKTKGWIYSLRTRNVNLTPSGDSAWFDEILASANYGTSRGTGVLIRTDAGWKISQYSLSFPIPNPLAARITGEIKQFELPHQNRADP
jgi:hypothetical protein